MVALLDYSLSFSLIYYHNPLGRTAELMAQRQTCSERKEVKRDREKDSRDKRIPEALASQPSQIDKLQAK